MFIERHRQDIWIACGIFALALLLRLLFIAWLNPDPITVQDDSWFYRYSARLMADGNGYRFPLGRFTSDNQLAHTADHPPGYTALLAGVFVLPGPDLIAGKALNAVLGAVGCSLLFIAGRNLASRPTGIAAGLLLTFWPSHIFYSTLPISEVTYSAMVTIVLLLFIWGLQRAPEMGWRFPIVIGLALGLATMVRGEAVLLFLVFGAVWWLSTRSFKRALQLTSLVVVGLALILGGWAIRNEIRMGAPIPISTGNTVNLAVSHWKGADGGGDLLRNFAVTGYYQGLPYPEREVKASQKQQHDALHYAFTHPRRELSLIPRRIYYLYDNDHTAVDWIEHYALPVGTATLDKLRAVSDAYYYVAGLLAVAGVWLWWRTRPEASVLLAGNVVYLTALIGIVYFGAPRYHAGLVPVFCLLAAPAVVALPTRFRAGLVVATLVFAGALIAFVQYPSFKPAAVSPTATPVRSACASQVPIALRPGPTAALDAASFGPISDGPRLGVITESSVKVWVRGCRQAKISIQYKPRAAPWNAAVESPSASTDTSADNTVVVLVSGLQPATSYDYRVLVGGKVTPKELGGSFETLAAQGKGSVFSFIVSSDVHFPNDFADGARDPILDTMAKQHVKFALLGGDQIEMEHVLLVLDRCCFATSRADYELGYRGLFAYPAFANFVANTPTLLMWDDHDIANDWSQESALPYPWARGAFDAYAASANPAPRAVGALNYVFRAGDVEIYVLDTRSYRSPDLMPDSPEKTMLGAAQKQDLEQWLLTSKARFKFIYSSVMWGDFSNHIPSGESWPAFHIERNEILDFIQANRIPGVLLLSGDEHWASVSHLLPWGIYEIAPAPITVGVRGPERNDPQVLFASSRAHPFGSFFGLFTVDTTVCPARLTVQLIDKNNKPAYTLDLTAAGLGEGANAAQC